MTLVAFFKFVENHVKCCVLEDEVTSILVKLTQGLQRSCIVRIYQSQFFYEQQSYYIIALLLVDGYSRETCKISEC